MTMIKQVQRIKRTYFSQNKEETVSIKWKEMGKRVDA